MTRCDDVDSPARAARPRRRGLAGRRARRARSSSPTTRRLPRPRDRPRRRARTAARELRGDCELWGRRRRPGRLRARPRPGRRFTAFKLADLGRPNADLGGFAALFGRVLWSPDGQRVAWCGHRRVGFDLEIGGAARRLPRCPVAYTPDDRSPTRSGTARRRRETVLRAEGHHVRPLGTDGSPPSSWTGSGRRYDGAGGRTRVAESPKGGRRSSRPKLRARSSIAFQTRAGSLRRPRVLQGPPAAASAGRSLVT